MRRRQLLLSASGAFLAACGAPAVVPSATEIESSLIRTSYAAADRLTQRAPSLLEGAVIVTTLAHIDNLRHSSTLGRLIAEQIASRLSTVGAHAVEVRAAQALFVRDNSGQFVLSRDPAHLPNIAKARTVVAGHYAFSRETVYITVRAIDPNDNRIVASTDYTLSRTQNIADLLK